MAGAPWQRWQIMNASCYHAGAGHVKLPVFGCWVLFLGRDPAWTS